MWDTVYIHLQRNRIRDARTFLTLLIIFLIRIYNSALIHTPSQGKKSHTSVYLKRLMKQIRSVNERKKYPTSTQVLTVVSPRIYGMPQVLLSGNPTASAHFPCIFLVLICLIKFLMRTTYILLSLLRYSVLSKWHRNQAVLSLNWNLRILIY